MPFIFTLLLDVFFPPLYGDVPRKTSYDVYLSADLCLQELVLQQKVLYPVVCSLLSEEGTEQNYVESNYRYWFSTQQNDTLCTPVLDTRGL